MLNCNQSQQVKTMKNYYLKFKDQAELEATLIAAGLATSETIAEEIVFAPKVTLDVIGLIYKPTGKTLQTENNLNYPETAAVDGWHANLKADLTAEQEEVLPSIAAPATHYRVWAGE
jgi:hypothetical protein